ncbi:MAG: 3D domain-containing protein [bacterium]|nr:3D domain-containing protein [bacterium]
MKNSLKIIKKLLIYITFVILLFVVIASGYNNEVITIEDISNVRSIQAIHLVSKYNKDIIETKNVRSFDEVIKYGSTMPVKFNGIMTGYGPDCVGCSGKTGCSPRQNVKNGNIYFNDSEYGNVNIVATDSRIPCGTIIKITNSTLGDEILAIALDRGGAIRGTKMDFLVETETKASKIVGKQNVTYEIIRWSW